MTLLFLTTENMAWMKEAPPMPDVFVDGIRIPGTLNADRIWRAPDISIMTNGKHADRWLDLLSANRDGCSKFMIVFAGWEEHIFHGYVKSYNPGDELAEVVIVPTTKLFSTQLRPVPPLNCCFCDS